jgi:beta-glucanase (GH16 family)
VSCFCSLLFWYVTRVVIETADVVPSRFDISTYDYLFTAYGQCGVGAYCLGGCDPLFSHTLKSCVPAPVCQTTDYKLNSLSGVTDISEYLGDASKTNWQVSGKPVVYNNNALLLTMAPDTVGTLMSSTHYVWYGKISATMTSSQGQGVVTAFIMMSDVKDEIDFEFVGTDINDVQSNFYSQGVTNCKIYLQIHTRDSGLTYQTIDNNEQNLSVSNTVSNVHTYTIDWQPDQLSWLVDGKVLRTKKRSDTWNSTSNRFDYPQTPSRIMLSLWPAGLPSNGQGTVEWAGGLINWNSPYMQNGYYYAMVQDVNVQCYDPPNGANIQGKKSYIYTDPAATNNTVEITDTQVILKSLSGTGENPGTDPSTASSSKGSSPSATPESVPGVSGAGTRGEDPSGSSPGGSGSGTASGATSSPSSSTGFSQGTTGKSGGSRVEEKLGGSVFAVLVAVAVALCW